MKNVSRYKKIRNGQREERGVARTVFLSVFVVWLVVSICTSIYGGYRYKLDYSHHWELADKSSTIEAKQRHIEAFVSAIEDGCLSGDFASYNALFMRQPSNSIDHNFEALKTLRDRLNEISTMSPSSFEYNTAIQQITQQEQGEAASMLRVFEGCYIMKNYFIAWEWVGLIPLLALIIFAFGLLGGAIINDFG